MSSPIETGCSEVSTTVTLLDGNNSASKDDSSRSTTTSPIIEPSHGNDRATENENQDALSEKQTTSDKLEGNGNNRERQDPESNGTKNDIVDGIDNKNDSRVALLKKHDYLGLYNNSPKSSERTFVRENKLSTDNNNRKTNNSKVR